MKKKGKITKVIFNNGANGYTVAIFKSDDGNSTITGSFHDPREGAEYELEGEYTVHPKYGEQFQVRTYVEVVPEDAGGIRRYLSSGAIKGVGPKTADLIVDAFGDEALDVIENSPVKLLTIKGIGAKTMAQIVESYAETRDFGKASLEMMEMGFEFNHAVQIFGMYGTDSLEIIRENPYLLIDDIRGLNFTIVDRIADNLGFGAEHETRVRSGIKSMLAASIEFGSTYMNAEDLVDKSVGLLDVSRELVEEILGALVFEGEIRNDTVDGVSVIYLASYYNAERRVAHNLARIKEAASKPINASLENLINDAEEETRVTLSEEQRSAVRTAMTENVSIITGGPGTGKTTIINSIVHAFERLDMDVTLAAPTGRAAKRMEEASGHEAKTIHRLLGYVFNENREQLEFGKNEDSPLDTDVVIIDEASMVDLMLMDGLMRALKDGTRLVIVGDADQLPSVGAGNVLRDIIKSEFIATVRLKEIFRQAAESKIIVNAHLINNGEDPELNSSDGDFFFIRKEGEEEILAAIKELASGRLSAHYDFIEAREDIQILTPTKKGMLGTKNLNVVLQEALNPADPEKRELKHMGRIFREGDKVMQIRNNYELRWIDKWQSEGEGVFNGDLGIIDEIDPDEARLVVIFDDKRAVLGEAELEDLELAYAVTVHKSQGSEFSVVIMPMANFNIFLMTRNILYTAVTRGKRLVVMVGREDKLRGMIANNRIDDRNTGLADKLRAYDMGTVPRM